MAAIIDWADEDNEFILSDGSSGNPGCDCGNEDAVVRVDGVYYCQKGWAEYLMIFLPPFPVKE